MNAQVDILGWGPTKWGMSEAEIVQLLQSEISHFNPPIEYPNPPREVTLGISEKNIGGCNCNIHFTFDKISGLDQVIIKPNIDEPIRYFESFFQLLTQKYGPATLKHKEDHNIYTIDTIIWRFPSTVIELIGAEVVSINRLIFTLLYVPATSRDLSFL